MTSPDEPPEATGLVWFMVIIGVMTFLFALMVAPAAVFAISLMVIGAVLVAYLMTISDDARLLRARELINHLRSRT